ncbi:hypothetical protein [Gryllotalpicola protaetiae]|uniref:Uncharacterized protein n=1 Tax=Gryllotalpicola protaetiae TaxID=2419771 RepID=A0A387BMP8_9MICO|nr:hypothetical protein [Gryllotalpicola protaetiae]AYG03672.1 hypothetical protein D7I44_09080 [Gryllotalpicola protaetiae]
MSTERTPNAGGAPRVPRRSRRRKNIEFVEHLTGQEQMLITFPWSRNLSAAEREEFAAALAGHPSSFSNAQLEALIVSWKRRAQLAQARASSAGVTRAA